MEAEEVSSFVVHIYLSHPAPGNYFNGTLSVDSQLRPGSFMVFRFSMTMGGDLVLYYNQKMFARLSGFDGYVNLMNRASEGELQAVLIVTVLAHVMQNLPTIRSVRLQSSQLEGGLPGSNISGSKIEINSSPSMLLPAQVCRKLANNCKFLEVDAVQPLPM